MARIRQQDTKLTNQTAWRAVREFSKMIPTLTGFARSITGNPDLVVVLDKNSTHTDGKKIMVAPPLALGADLRHPDRSLCDKRGPTRRMLCDACAARDMVMWHVYHEIGHNVGDSFQMPEDSTRQALRDLVDEWHPAEACGHAKLIKQQISYSYSVLPAAGAVNGYLPQIIKSLEDSRVDGRMLLARPGLRNMRRAFVLDTFINGIESLDGEITHWRDAPLNAQIIIGLLLYANDEDECVGYLSPDAQRYLEDPQLLEAVRTAASLQNVNEITKLSVKVWRRLCELGVCYVPKCEVPPPPPPMPSLDEEKDDNGGDSDDRSDESDGDDPSSGDSTGDPEDSDQGSSDGDSGDAGSESDDEPDASDQDFNGDFENESADGGSSRLDQEDGAAEPATDSESLPDEDSDASEDLQPGGDAGPGDDEDSDPNRGENAGSPGDTEDDEPLADEGSFEDSHEGSQGDDPADPGSATEAGQPGGGGTAESPDDRRDSDGESDSLSEGTGDGEPRTGDESSDGSNDESGTEEDGSSAPLEETGLDPVGDDSVWNIPREDGGDPESIKAIIDKFSGHDSEEGGPDGQDVERMLEEVERLLGARLAVGRQAEAAINRAVQQAMFFEGPSEEIVGVTYANYPDQKIDWHARSAARSRRGATLSAAEFMPAENVIGSSLMKARIVFSENKRGKEVRNLKTGRVNARVLGKRAHLGDERVFKKRYLPGKRSYFVLIGLDCSGSNMSDRRMEKAKRAVFAQAELLNRLGIPFAVYAHSGGHNSWVNWPDDPYHRVWLLPVKAEKDPWNSVAREKLAAVQPVMENYDGHTLQVYRKMVQSRTETDRVIMYYTDGAMPAANYDEELRILQSEILECRKRNITLMAVGIQTDSPIRHGFDTVRVDKDEDLEKVVTHLGKKLVE